MSAANPILKAMMPLFKMTHVFIQGGMPLTFDSFRTDVMLGFEAAEQEAQALSVLDSAWQEAKFVVAAFIDEAVLNSDHEMALAWSRETLQLIFFKEHLAGYRFFERLDCLNAEPYKNMAILELYYWCLLLGFKGKYHKGKGKVDALLKIQDDLKKLLETYHQKDSFLFTFFELNDTQNVVLEKVPKRIGKKIWACWVLVCGLVYGGSYLYVQAQFNRLKLAMNEQTHVSTQ